MTYEDILWLIIAVLAAVGFVLGMLALYRGVTHYSVALHLVLSIFLAPVEIPFAVRELRSKPGIKPTPRTSSTK